MTTDLEKLSNEFARALEQAFSKAIRELELEPDVIVSMFDDIESSFLPKVEKHPELVIATKIRVLEQKLDALMGRGLPFERIAALQENIRALGYEDMDRESLREIIFARYCLEYARPDQAKAAMEMLCVKLNETLKTEKWKGHRESKKLAEKILRSIG